MKTLTKEQVEHIARLAKVTLTPDEEDLYTQQLGKTIEYVENLTELDTAHVEATNNGITLENAFFEDGADCTRQLTQEQATSNAKNKKDSTYFVVKRIM